MATQLKVKLKSSVINKAKTLVQTVPPLELLKIDCFTKTKHLDRKQNEIHKS